MKKVILAILISLFFVGQAAAKAEFFIVKCGSGPGEVDCSKPEPEKSCCQQWEDYGVRSNTNYLVFIPMPTCERKYRTKIKMVVYEVRIYWETDEAFSGVSRIFREGTLEQTLEDSVNLALEENEGWELSHFDRYAWNSWSGPETHRIWLRRWVCLE